MTPTKAGILGVAIGATCSLAVAAGGFAIYDDLAYTPSTQEGSCDHARYSFDLTVLGDTVMGNIVIKDADDRGASDRNPNWVVSWRSGGYKAEHLGPAGFGSRVVSSFASDLSDLDEGATRSVWIRRTDSATWCKLTSSLG